MPTINIHDRLKKLGVKSTFITAIASKNTASITAVTTFIDQNIDRVCEMVQGAKALGGDPANVSSILEASKLANNTFEAFEVLYTAICKSAEHPSQIATPASPSKLAQIKNILGCTPLDTF